MLSTPWIAPTATKPSKLRHGGSSHRLLDPVSLPLPSRHHSRILPSPKRYGSRYELARYRAISPTPRFLRLSSRLGRHPTESAASARRLMLGIVIGDGTAATP